MLSGGAPWSVILPPPSKGDSPQLCMHTCFQFIPDFLMHFNQLSLPCYYIPAYYTESVRGALALYCHFTCTTKL